MSLIQKFAKAFFSSDAAEVGDLYADEAGDIWQVPSGGIPAKVGAGGGSQPNVTDGTTTIDAPALIQLLGAVLSGDSTEATFTIGGLPLQRGEGSPTGSVVPTQVGAWYFDTAGNALYWAAGATDTSWCAVAGNTAGNADGLSSVPGYGALLLALGGAAISVLENGNIEIQPASGVVKITDLPTSDPMVANQVWSNLGILTLSSG